MARAGAGALDQIIIIEAPTVAADGYGGGPVVWATHARAWARVQPVSAREGERQGGERASTMYMLEMRTDGLDGLTAEMRIRWFATAANDVTMNIREIRRPPYRDMLMTVMAESGVTQ